MSLRVYDPVYPIDSIAPGEDTIIKDRARLKTVLAIIGYDSMPPGLQESYFLAPASRRL
jgi:hypothetical protein